MKAKNELRGNFNYFQKSEWMKYVGLTLVILGAILFVFGWSYLSYLFSIAAVPTGLVLLLARSITSSSDDDIAAYIAGHLENLEIDAENDKDFKARCLKSMEPEVCEGYEYKEGIMLKKPKKGVLRSSEYTKAILYPMKDGIRVSRHTISLVSHDEIRQDIEIPYFHIKRFEIAKEDLKLTFGKNTFALRSVRLEIEYGEDSFLSLPFGENVQTEDFVARIQKLMVSSSEHTQ
ncbi:MAG: hypothetical protein IJY47_00295 [Clostridia bacterium]|nr:hypothetical protein [Clostridia bacterium]